MALKQVYGITLTLMLAVPAVARAQSEWVVWESGDVESACGVINTVSLEFVVRVCDGALVLVTGPDLGYSNTFVSDDGEVFIDDELSGFISFEEDADGFFTLWWVDADGYVIDFDDVNGEPFLTPDVAGVFQNVPCAVEGDVAGDQSLWEGDADCDEPYGDNMMLPLAGLDDDVHDGDPSGTCGVGSLTLVLFTYLGMMFISKRHRY